MQSTGRMRSAPLCGGDWAAMITRLPLTTTAGDVTARHQALRSLDGGFYPLHVFTTKKDVAMVEYLLARGDDPCSIGPEGELLLQLAAEVGALHCDVPKSAEYQGGIVCFIPVLTRSGLPCVCGLQVQATFFSYC